MNGRELFETLVKSTGLPEESTRVRFEKLLTEKGRSLETLNLDDVREMLSDLLLELINEQSAELI
jgi:hypothetical protein